MTTEKNHAAMVNRKEKGRGGNHVDEIAMMDVVITVVKTSGSGVENQVTFAQSPRRC
jgi:hypothetical protein